MDQKAINQMWVAVAKLSHGIAETLFDAAQKMESSGDPEKFRKAQEIKGYANMVDAESDKMRSSYPHLFKST